MEEDVDENQIRHPLGRGMAHIISLRPFGVGANCGCNHILKACVCQKFYTTSVPARAVDR